MIIIVLIGPPGSGKGTQGDLIVKDLGFVKITIGDLLREEVNAKTGLGNEIAFYLDKGHLVPDKLICDLTFKEMQLYNNKNIILDGTPRTIMQAEFLDKELLSINKTINAVVELNIKEGLLFDRITNRYICSNCKASFSKRIHNDLRAPCIYCGSKDFFIRNDDKVNVLKERIEVYNKETAKILNYYNDKKKLYTVDASQNIDEVAKKIKMILSAL